MNYFCCDETRRNAVKRHPFLNGIDFLEVLDGPISRNNQRQTTLLVHFIKALIPESLTKNNVVIEGGERIANIKVARVTDGLTAFLRLPDLSVDPARILVVSVDQSGDFSTYTLRLVKDAEQQELSEVPKGIDPVLSAVDFSFKIECPSDFDCKTGHACTPETFETPEISYLAKDYTSFRQLMLDRMSFLVPSWKERNPADLGITLIELLAYVGDYLSYQQDAVATEAYLQTARKRISVRRHARLVDYFMHDGCNARAWVHIQVAPDKSGLLLKNYRGSITRILTRATGISDRSVLIRDSPEYNKALNKGVKVFELVHDILLDSDHNEMQFYTWGSQECCLPKGATQATLLNHLPNLKQGYVLMLTEVLGPQTGEPGDANPVYRHPVRLTEVILSNDPLYPQITDSPPTGSPHEGIIPVTEIKWHSADALPFSLCISSGNHMNVSVAVGNIVLADHGLTIHDKSESSLNPDTVPLSKIVKTNPDFCNGSEHISIPPRFRPSLTHGPLTYTTPYDTSNPPESAYAAIKWTRQTLMPSINLYEVDPNGDEIANGEWNPKHDLLNSAASKKEFVVETESEGITQIRFGDNQQGLRPPSGTQFKAKYRVGNGTTGNVGAMALAHIVTDDPAITNNELIENLWNPLAATGGMDPEPVEKVRQEAPVAFRRQERAVTPADYEEIAKQCNSDLQRAAGTFRWTGSWRTVFLTVDRLGGQTVSDDFEKNIRKCLERYRMAGHDLEVDSPQYVSLEIEMLVCVKANYFASDVKAELLNVFSNRILQDGHRGIFHADNYSFGQAVYLSPLYAAAQAIQGVDSVEITKFRRQGNPLTDAIDSGRLLLGRLEIARLDNDPNFQEHGVFNLIMRGGKG